jgi:hypothetical protein
MDITVSLLHQPVILLAASARDLAGTHTTYAVPLRLVVADMLLKHDRCWLCTAPLPSQWASSQLTQGEMGMKHP